ncbi:hypothetical protein [Actimicrobium sp. CCI2.3]|uniref:hypothetical protein n=1 Tax=Actimicrobium sp. CCI2.3 TaxID=3048616 RepID=UPI002AB33173|nr:hypothetical protein [Actimicrobium sp. CCI2.3]MDY7576088.1 hypothetical protein [Actimicrobium sp. CCI2.3]MEB0023018.1 hypothetical protein [Actimicrobium sp. CCI2.3]
MNILSTLEVPTRWRQQNESQPALYKKTVVYASRGFCEKSMIMTEIAHPEDIVALKGGEDT